MDKFCRNDIISYLQIFARHMGNVLNYNDKLIADIVDQIESRVSNSTPSNLFGQALYIACKKCRLRYTERGNITRREYSYCIRTDETSNDIPVDCPKSHKDKFYIEKVEDDQDIIDIRKRSKR